ncbi:type II toxin-antitoxin system VapC family toxin [Adlercreutzia murintestinalis]|jgi:Predicted nucleic-acid-binding protein, contains PIN domain|uniref:type II toxin-antitoxin system VapC family toxin n=1 Tax=Adlercreutzia murintestinalis TaxID=2941325 RepID=UPI002040C820|nr:PIN domain-containing protein [Adlercreutzia murintestinalis]
MNVLLDTCVVIDYLGRKEPFFHDAELIMAAGFFRDVKLWTTGQALNDAFYVLRKYLPADQIQQAIVELLEVITPVTLAPDDYQRAARQNWDDFEDCLVALCAQKARADYLITRDASGFTRSSVPPISPADWLALMRTQKNLTYSVVSLED